jgi:hypothetical protein
MVEKPRINLFKRSEEFWISVILQMLWVFWKILELRKLNIANFLTNNNGGNSTIQLPDLQTKAVNSKAILQLHSPRKWWRKFEK